MGKTLSSLFVVIGSKVGIAAHHAKSHQIHILSQTLVTMLSDMTRLGHRTGLIHTRISTAEGNELLVARKPGNITDFCQEVDCSQLPNTGNRGDDVHLSSMRLFGQIEQGFSNGLPEYPAPADAWQNQRPASHSCSYR